MYINLVLVSVKGGWGRLLHKLEAFTQKKCLERNLGDWLFIGLIILHKILGYGFNSVGRILPPPACVSSVCIIHGEQEMQVMFKQH